MPVEAVVDVVKDEVADNLEEIAQATRRINANSVSFFVGGLAVGAAVGFYFGYKWNKEKIKAEAFAQSEVEIEKIRDLYKQKTVAATPKPSLDEVARIARDEAMAEAGYSPIEREEHIGRPLKPPVPVREVMEPIVTVPDTGDVWNYAKEMEGRLSGDPYVIHQDEFMSNETKYPHVVYTYYALDDVLVDDENDHPLPHADLVVGLNNLQFGHGSDDEDVVFVRNDRMELEMEICRVNKSFEEEVLGLENHEHDDEDESD